MEHTGQRTLLAMRSHPRNLENQADSDALYTADILSRPVPLSFPQKRVKPDPIGGK
jgi:hypothetical protein